MSEFLVPLNSRRAQEMLRDLSFYTAYSKKSAERVRELLVSRYPRLFERMEVRSFDFGAFTLEMTGATTTDPLLFVSHLDSLSCKQAASGGQPVPLQRAHLVALLEALDALLSEGYRPGGDLILALSMDGLSGGLGAKSIAEYLKRRKISPCFVLDHGGYVTHAAFRRFLPHGAPLALIGITEKGQPEGHIDATEAPEDTMGSAPNMLFKSSAWLSRHDSRDELCLASEMMLKTLSQTAPARFRFLLRHPRFFFPVLRVRWHGRAIMAQFFKSRLTITAIHTRGEASRPPASASLGFSLSTVPGKRKLGWWQARLYKNTCRSGGKLTVTIENEHSPQSGVDHPAWDALETAIEILFDRVVIAPCLSPHVTDGRFYAPLKGNVYRFSPFLLTAQQALRGEFLADEPALQTAVQFFRQMLSV
ncbi:MAG: M20/M25/M40 family metallo-hydrolase [Firmicutes bacterium]|nr:M20/M25/M40 family metallo-hydrolase [Bacillota bacterium]